MWSEDEKSAVYRHLSTFIETLQLPGKADIEACMQLEPALLGRTWRNVKDFCRSQQQSRVH